MYSTHISPAAYSGSPEEGITIIYAAPQAAQASQEAGVEPPVPQEELPFVAEPPTASQALRSFAAFATERGHRLYLHAQGRLVDAWQQKSKQAAPPQTRTVIHIDSYLGNTVEQRIIAPNPPAAEKPHIRSRALIAGVAALAIARAVSPERKSKPPSSLRSYASAVLGLSGAAMIGVGLSQNRRSRMTATASK